MARSLPLAPGEVPADADVASAELLGVVSVFDPAMCCSTGLCGPGVDPSLIAIARDLRWLEKRGVTVNRFGLAQDPATFASTSRVAGLLQAFGNAALPAVLVNADVLCYGRYPSRDELVAALTKPAQDASRSCCTPGSGCC